MGRGEKPGVRVWLAGTVAALAWLSCAVPANAGTIGYEMQPFSGYGLVYVAAPGEANRVTVTFKPGAVELVDAGVAQVDPGSGCSATSDPQRVDCPIARLRDGQLTETELVVAELDDGRDTADVVNATDGFRWAPSSKDVAGLDPSYFIDAVKFVGGDGNDTLSGGSGRDTLIGGGGSDELDGAEAGDIVLGGFYAPLYSAGGQQPDAGDDVNGGRGDDRVDGGLADDRLDGGEGADILAGGPGADDYFGGPGEDIAGFFWSLDMDGASPVRPITADIGGGANDGAASDGPLGARDNVHESIEGLRGGYADDTLTGDSGDNTIDGGAGNDVIDGGPGADVLIGSAEWDFGRADADDITGGEGDDAIDGANGPDLIDGGPGDDMIDGGTTADGAADTINGGPGDDRVYGGHLPARSWESPPRIWPDGPDGLSGGGGDDYLVTRDGEFDPQACEDRWGYSIGSDCWNTETPTHCKPGSPVCTDPADSAACGDGTDAAYLDPGDTAADCESVDPDRPLPAGATAIGDEGAAPVTTGDGNAGADPKHALETAVTTPLRGAVTIDQTPEAPQISGAEALLPVAVTTRAPTTTVDRPNKFAFSLDASVAPGDPATVSVRRNGDPVSVCTGPTGTASPDPCIARRTRLHDGDTVLSVLSTRAGGWRFGAPVAAEGAPSVTAEGAPGGASTASPDRTRPTLRFTLRSHYTLRTLTRGLRVPITCSEACRASVELRLSRSTAKRLKLNTTAGRAGESVLRRGSVPVKLGRRAAVKLSRLHRTFAVLVVAKAIDAAGNRSRTATWRIRVR